MCSICGSVSTPSGLVGSGRSPGRRVRVERPVVGVGVVGVDVDGERRAELGLVLVHAPSATAVPSMAAPRRNSRRSYGPRENAGCGTASVLWQAPDRGR